MKALILSRFDVIEGPKTIFSVPELQDQKYIKQLPSLMNFYDEGFFIHFIGDYESANLIFGIPSDYARGNKEVLLLSLVVKGENINIKKSREFLESCIGKLMLIPNAYQAFYASSDSLEGNIEMLINMKKILFSHLKTLPKETLEEKLQKSEDKFRLTFENAIDAIFWADVETGLIINCNKAAESLLEREKEDIIGKKQTFLHPLDKAEEYALMFKKHIEKFGVINDEATVITKSGKIIPVHISAALTTIGADTIIQGVFRNISDLKQAYERLEESEQNYKLIMENIDDIIVVLDPKYNFEYVGSKTLESLVGYRESEIYGRKALNFLHPDDLQRAMLAFKQGFLTGKGTIEVRFRNKKGEWIWYHLKGRGYIDGKGEQKALIVGRDINARKIAEEKLQMSEETLRKLHENILDVIIEVEQDGKIVYVSPQVQSIFGFKPSELVGTNNFDYVHPEDIISLREGLKKAWNLKNEIYIEFRTYHKKGHYVNISAKGNIVKINDKLRFVGILRDSTERLEIEKRIKESELKFKTLAELSFLGISIFKDGLPIYVNYAFLNIIEVSEEEISKWGKDEFKQLIYSEDLQEFEEHHDDKELTYRIMTRSGKIKWIERIARTIPLEGSIAEFITLTDVTNRKEIEKKRKQSEEKYRKAYEKENFYKDLFAHDINNILNNIGSSAYLLSDLNIIPKRNKKEQGLFNIISNQVNRGARLVSNVRILSEFETIESTIKDIEAFQVLNDTIRSISENYQEHSVNIHLETSQLNIDSEIKLNVKANELLVDIFENLFINAINHNQNSIVEILINLSEEMKDGKKFYKFEFKDNGIGISDDRKEKIFLRGYNKDKRVGGMGLGLSLVKTIVKSYNGRIWVEDKIKGNHEEGCNFIILIPSA